MKKTIFSNVFTGYIILTILLAFIIIFFSFQSIKYFDLSSKTDHLQKNASLLHDSILNLTKTDNNKLNKFVVDSGKKIETRITVVRKDGVVIADSEEDYNSMENHRDRSEIDAALKGDIGKTIRHSPTLKKDMLYIAVPLQDQTMILGAIRLSLYMQDIKVFFSKFKMNLIYSSFLVVIVAIVIMIFHDISELKKREQMKKNFAQNVSHELKTPLASIKAFLETIQDEKSYSEKYINIIKNNTERMINIVNDLLMLSEIESSKMDLIIEPINIKDMLENILKLFEKRSRNKKVAIKLFINTDLKTIRGDRFRLEQIFVNLLDNSLKYTEKGEIIVTVQSDKKYVNFYVKDTGIGIPEKNFQQIFERFYVVDKSRSRQLGGTGLGLSIVKHIVLLHKGKIDLQSQVGVGSTFIIKFPI
ncbi:ATP-binding protein [bacterium]